MRNQSHYSTARADALLHYALAAFGLALCLIGLVEVWLLRHDTQSVVWGGLATLGAMWWTHRMLGHAEADEKRCRMWS